MTTTDLDTCFAGLVRHHIATSAQPLPPTTHGITWIIGANGIYKRGVTAVLDLLIPVAPLPVHLPGLVPVVPHIWWPAWPRRLPAALLPPLLADARQAGGRQAIEKQYFIIWDDGKLRLRAPRHQKGTASRVRYQMPQQGDVLCDLHSHHRLPAYFSATDDADDLGLSVSVVIGTLWETPTMCTRVNVYGHRWVVPATHVFDGLENFHDTDTEETDADLHD
ncbi:MAG: hypothetical protein HC828_06835 [Blastochloris sp.]|nr:hypothetical protein [Blastochloris sp.]